LLQKFLFVDILTRRRILHEPHRNVQCCQLKKQLSGSSNLQAFNGLKAIAVIEMNAEFTVHPIPADERAQDSSGKPYIPAIRAFGYYLARQPLVVCQVHLLADRKANHNAMATSIIQFAHGNNCPGTQQSGIVTANSNTEIC
jgi:hypothetical protein